MINYSFNTSSENVPKIPTYQKPLYQSPKTRLLVNNSVLKKKDLTDFNNLKVDNYYQNDIKDKLHCNIVIVDNQMSYHLPLDLVEDNILDSESQIDCENQSDESLESILENSLENSLETEDLDIVKNKKQQQNCKRCGVIFVDIKTNPHSNSMENFDKRKLKIHSFLVVKGKSSNIWSFPKGRTNYEEEDENLCAERELFEETGIRISTKGLPKIVIGRNIYFIKHTKKEEFQNFHIHDEYEVAEVSWKAIHELRTLVCNKDLRAVLSFPKTNQDYYNIIYKNKTKKYHFKNDNRFDNRFLFSNKKYFNQHIVNSDENKYYFSENYFRY